MELKCVVTLMVEPTGAKLTDLVRSVRYAVGRVLFEAEDRGFSPDVTIAIKSVEVS